MQLAILAMGCFWHPEEKFLKIKGINSTEVGYCGGNSPNVTYEKVCGENTGHAEVVKLEFDENIISYDDIIKLFFKYHDATQVDGQGPNIGTNYRSEIFYLSDEQKKIAEKILNLQSGKIDTKISKEKNYVKAESYHQKYIQKKLLK